MQGKKHSLLFLLTLITRQRLQFLLLDCFLLSLACDHYYGKLRKLGRGEGYKAWCRWVYIRFLKKKRIGAKRGEGKKKKKPPEESEKERDGPKRVRLREGRSN